MRMHLGENQQRLVVSLEPDEIERLQIYREPVGTRYWSAFGRDIPVSYPHDSKISVHNLSALEEDLTSQVSIEGGRLVWAEPRMRARMDLGDDLYLYVADSFFDKLNTHHDPISEVSVSTAEIECPDPARPSRLIPPLGILMVAHTKSM